MSNIYRITRGALKHVRNVAKVTKNRVVLYCPLYTMTLVLINAVLILYYYRGWPKINVTSRTSPNCVHS